MFDFFAGLVGLLRLERDLVDFAIVGAEELGSIITSFPSDAETAAEASEPAAEVDAAETVAGDALMAGSAAAGAKAEDEDDEDEDEEESERRHKGSNMRVADGAAAAAVARVQITLHGKQRRQSGVE